MMRYNIISKNTKVPRKSYQDIRASNSKYLEEQKRRTNNTFICPEISIDSKIHAIFENKASKPSTVNTSSHCNEIKEFSENMVLSNRRIQRVLLNHRNHNMSVSLNSVHHRVLNSLNKQTPKSNFRTNRSFGHRKKIATTLGVSTARPLANEYIENISSPISQIRTEQNFCSLLNNSVSKNQKAQRHRNSTSVPRCMRFSSNISQETMRNIRRKIRMNKFLHKQFDPDLVANPLLQKVFKAKDTEYDDDTEKGNTYMMDYILEELPKKEFNNLCQQIENQALTIKPTYPAKRKTRIEKPKAKSLTTKEIFEQFLEKLEYINDKNIDFDCKVRIMNTIKKSMK